MSPEYKTEKEKLISVKLGRYFNPFAGLDTEKQHFSAFENFRLKGFGEITIRLMKLGIHGFVTKLVIEDKRGNLTLDSLPAELYSVVDVSILFNKPKKVDTRLICELKVGDSVLRSKNKGLDNSRLEMRVDLFYEWREAENEEGKNCNLLIPAKYIKDLQIKFDKNSDINS